MADTSNDAASQAGVERGTAIGRYIVLGSLGRGGMGTVLSAFDPDLDRKVALKLLSPAGGHSAADLGREARILAKLAHPNVAAVHDVGPSEHGLYVAMELVDGGDLARWREQRSRSAREILSVFLDAGRGLAAAHDKGLVHRDFKPTNVLIGTDGRVRVADFGLARLAAGSEDSLRPGDAMRGLSRGSGSATEVAGTPGFIAPEVLRGEPPDARSDQYSFCVSLVWCLTGSMPAELDDLEAALSAVPLQRAPRRAVVRGLSPEPSERFESMPALLDALATRPRTRLRVAVALGVGLVGGGVLTWTMGSSSAAPDRCAQGRAALRSTWDEARAAEVREALTATGTPYADQTARAVEQRLDAHARRWGEAHASLCARPSSEAETEGRLRCLDDRLIELSALLSALVEPSGDSVDHATGAVASLRSPESCMDDQWRPKPAYLEPPPSIAARVAELRPKLELGEAYEVTGQFDRALTVLAEVMREAEALGHAPMVAEAGYVTGLVLMEQGRYDDATPVLERAFNTALGAGFDDMMVQSASLLASGLGRDHAHLEQAELWNQLAGSAAGRRGSDTALAAAHSQSTGVLAYWRGDYDGAREALERALALYRQHLPADHPSIPAVLSLLAALESTQRHYVEAEARAREVLALRTSLLGNQHPDLIVDEITLASTLTPQGKPDEAIEHLERALDLGLVNLDPEHPRRLAVQNNLASALNRKGDHERARELYVEILRVRERDQGPDDPATALAHHNLAVTLFDLGRADEAVLHHRQAIASFEAAYGPEHVQVVNARKGLATTLEVAGRCDEAHEVIEPAWAVVSEPEADAEPHPLIAFVANQRARLRLCRGEGAEAVAMARRAVEHAESMPGEPRAALPSIVVTLARALLSAGQLEEARAQAERALDSLPPSSSTSRARAELVLAEVAKRQGDPGQMRSHVERARAQLPEGPPYRAGLERQIDALLADGVGSGSP